MTDSGLVDTVVADIVKRFGRKGKLAFNPRVETCRRIDLAVRDAIQNLSTIEQKRAAIRQIFDRLYPHIAEPHTPSKDQQLDASAP